MLIIFGKLVNHVCEYMGGGGRERGEGGGVEGALG